MKEMITVEKEVYEAVLRNSVRVIDLEAENQQLKELLKECKPYIGYSIKKKEYLEWTPPDSNLLTIIDNAIGEKK